MKSTMTLIATSLLLATLAMAQPPHYVVTDLGTLGGTFSQPFFVNGFGMVSGAATLPDNTSRSVLWLKGLKLDIGKPGLGGPNNIAFGDNQKMQAVGEAEAFTADPNGEDFCGFGTHLECLPFLWQSGVMSALPTLGGHNGVANQINTVGEVAGFAENTTPDPGCSAPQVFQFKPVIWAHGQVEQLPTIDGDPDGVALSVNGRGQAVGASGTCTTFNFNTLFNLVPVHPLLWQNGKVIDLGTLGGITGQAGGNLAWDINNRSQVVGVSDLPGDQTFHAFLWTEATGMQDLGTLTGDTYSTASGINDEGMVVGLSLDASFDGRAFLWENGVMTDLNSLIPPNSSLHLLSACSINARGQIAGLAITSAGEYHAFLATPRR